MSKRRGMLLVVHAAAVLGRVMVSGPTNVKLVASKTAADKLLLAALSSMLCTFSVVPVIEGVESLMI